MAGKSKMNPVFKARCIEHIKKFGPQFTAYELADQLKVSETSVRRWADQEKVKIKFKPFRPHPVEKLRKERTDIKSYDKLMRKMI